MESDAQREAVPNEDGRDVKTEPSNVENPGRKLLALLTTHNPFYLLSTAFLLHGSAHWMQTVGGHETGFLTALISGYVIMMAVTAIVIVRAGGVWEDARSILLIIPALLVELSLTFDNTVLLNPIAGAVWAIAGFLFSVAVFEGLLWGLRIRLAACFRLPMHAFSAALFLYPLVIVPAIRGGDVLTASWRIFLFFPLIGLLLLALLPAVRRGATVVAENGTPWRWPWFPWALFGVLLLSVGLRGYSLGLSFDPVMSIGSEAALELQSAWSPFFLVPILFGIAILIFEAGRESRNRMLERIGLAFPVLCLMCALPWGMSSAPRTEFLSELTRQLGSPMMLTLALSSLFYAFAWWRKAEWAEPAFAVTLILMWMASEPIFFATWLPGSWALWTAMGVLLASGIQRQDSRRVFAASLCFIVLIATGPMAIGPAWARRFVITQQLMMSIFIIGRLFHDEFGRLLHALAAVGIFVGVSVALVMYSDPPPELPVWMMPTYVSLLVALPFAVAYPLGSLIYFWSGVGSFVISLMELTRRSYLNFRDVLQGEGILSFLMAFVLFLVAAGISALKAGVGLRLSGLLPTDQEKHQE